MRDEKDRNLGLQRALMKLSLGMRLGRALDTLSNKTVPSDRIKFPDKTVFCTLKITNRAFIHQIPATQLLSN